ncbi:MAG TPA: DUF4388 domain-containing protein [Thermodesulfovibrionales bacterium]|nr:DUF4388 domain-containing protein [Thermodesulfovibrionales bacterium]
MALEGSLLDFGLADILQLIYFQKKTGVLTLSGRVDRVSLFFSDGNIIAAESRKRTEENRLGRILLKKGLITEEDLGNALEEQKATGVKVGDIFMNRGLVGKEDIMATVTTQITETVVQLFSWKEGTYEFQAQPVPINKDVPITLDTQHLLMDGLRIIDEWSLIEGKITLDTIFRKAGGADMPLTPDEENVLRCVDGENDVSTIIDLSGLGDFEVSKILVSLLERGIIEAAEPSPLAIEPEVLPVAAKGRSLMDFLPLALFIFAVLIAIATPVFRKSGSSFGNFLMGDSFKRLEQVRAIEALRFRAEEYKYSTGSYPTDLREIGGSTDVWGRPYVYVAERDGVTIISAGPDGRLDTADDIY